MRKNEFNSWARAMTACLIFWISTAAIVGCSTGQTLPDWNPPVLTEEDKTAQQPDECPWPDFTEFKYQGIFYNALDRAGFVQFLQCLEVFDSNITIAEGNAESVEALVEMYEGAVAVGDRQQSLAEFQLNELERDRRDANLEAWAYKGLLALVLVAVAL